MDIKFAGTSQTINSVTPDHSTDPTGAMGATVGLTTIPQETNGAAADVVVTNQPSGFAPTSTTVHNGWTFVDSQGPTLTAVIKDPATTPDPNHSGPSAGGQHLEVDGTCFIGVQEIDFVTSAGTSKVLPAAMTCSDGSVLNPSVPCPTRDQIRFDVPRAPSNLGQLVADIVVVTPSGRSPITAADQWTYTGFSPSVGPLSPTAGLTGGGETITINGSNFDGGTSSNDVTQVNFGTAPASFTYVNANQLTATAPPHAAGTVHVQVKTHHGTSSDAPNNQYSYSGTPQVTGVSPNKGPIAGGGSTVVSGSHFTGATSVAFGSAITVNCGSGNPCTVQDDAHILVNPTPAKGSSSSTVDITVTTPGGTSSVTTPDQFTFVAGPTVTTVSPSSGPSTGGTSVVITGTGFDAGGAAVAFGDAQATSVTVNSATQITAVAPSHAVTTVRVVVTTYGGSDPPDSQNRDLYTFTAAKPTVTSISPTSGTTAGGTLVTINGTGFDDGAGDNQSRVASVLFDGVPLSLSGNGYVFVSANQIKILSPRMAQGHTLATPVHVQVLTDGGQSDATNADRFTYVAVASQFTSIAPLRLLDTRSDPSIHSIPAGQQIDFKVTGVGSIPAHGVAAVVINVTAVPNNNTQPGGYLTVWPKGATQPSASNLNYTIGGPPVPNVVEVAVGDGEMISIFAFSDVDVILDAGGYLTAPVDGTGAGLFNGLDPVRILDTRQTHNPIGPNSTQDLVVAGTGGVPSTGVDSVVLNVTAVPGGDQPPGGFLTVYPKPADSSGQPTASNVNFGPGPPRANRVVVKLGDAGAIRIYNFNGTPNVIVDVNGYYTKAGGTGSGYQPITPARLFDSRPDSATAGGTTLSPWGPNETRTITVAGTGKPAPAGATAVVMNLTVVPTGNTELGGFLTIFPTNANHTVPNVSDINFGPGPPIANLVVVKLSAAGSIDINNFNGQNHVIGDVEGYFTGT